MRLREATVDDAPLLARWQEPEYVGEFNRFGMPPPSGRHAIPAAGQTRADGGNLIVEVLAGARPIGTVSWHAVRYGPNPESSAWNIGINLIPEGRGQGFGAEAQRLLAERLFANTRANRVEAMTDVENAAEQRSLEKAGFTREGVLYGAQHRDGGWHDLVVYSLVRQDGAPR